MSKSEDFIEVWGARVHNLKNIDVRIPRDKLVVITGLSGSGKSSLAFDTIYAEGQRRYIETFASYARQFLGSLERPDVDKIEGLSPVIAIEQKTVNKNPRSTVGTVTEIYDFIRLLFARAAEAYSFETGEKMVSYSDEQIQELISTNYKGARINILSPVIRSRKGHYRELFEQIAKQGFVKVRVNGEIRDIVKGMKLDRYKTHDIEIVVDRLQVDDKPENQKRLEQSIKTAMDQGEGIMMVLEHESEQERYFSRHLMCPSTGISYPDPEPNNFSFNSPKGACPTCNGIGSIHQINLERIVPDPKKSIKAGALAPHGNQKKNWLFSQLELIAERFEFSLSDPFESIPEPAKQMILFGGKEKFSRASKTLGVTREFKIDFEGVATFIEQTFKNADSTALRRWAKEYMDHTLCPTCEGSRLRKESMYFRFNDKNIADLSEMDISDLAEWFKQVYSQVSEKQQKIAG